MCRPILGAWGGKRLAARVSETRHCCRRVALFRPANAAA
ncbi:hypothetical protein QFZ49_006334 [Streptomyces turgidiscabies]|uniref:Uncharacterized protein n=1 Tax=Streptomyces turgidiscabies TaxID=85558 RepID=A0ABU0RWJ9_9ACTN|nr:hypothetical protein [Streptomyces turgidiscabies]